MTPFQAQLATKQLVRDMVEEFGADRAAYYCSLGYSWSEAVAAHCDWLAAENEKLRKQLELGQFSERVPLSSGGGDIDPAPARRKGLANKLKVRGE